MGGSTPHWTALEENDLRYAAISSNRVNPLRCPDGGSKMPSGSQYSLADIKPHQRNLLRLNASSSGVILNHSVVIHAMVQAWARRQPEGDIR